MGNEKLDIGFTCVLQILTQSPSTKSPIENDILME